MADKNNKPARHRTCLAYLNQHPSASSRVVVFHDGSSGALPSRSCPGLAAKQGVVAPSPLLLPGGTSEEGVARRNEKE
jgi:hypothetical protein